MRVGSPRFTRQQWGWPALFALALLVRIWQIDRLPLWLDETSFIQQAYLPFNELVANVFRVNPTPPLYVLFMGWWIPLGPAGEVWPRLPSAVFGSAFVVAVAWLAGELAGRRAAFIAGAFALLQPLAIWYAQEARTYALSMALAAAMTAAEVRFLRRGELRWAIALGVVTLVLESSHYAAVLPIGIAIILAIAYPASLKRRLSALTALGISALPLLATREGRDYFSESGGISSIAASTFVATIPDTFHGVRDAWVRFVGGPAIDLYPGMGGTMAILAAASGIFLLLLGPRASRWIVGAFLLTCAAALLVPATRVLLSDRYASLTLGLLIAAGAVAVAGLRPRLRGSVIATTLALLLVADTVYWLDPRVGKGPNYREPALYLASRALPSDVIVEADLDQTFDYYALRVFGASARVVRPRVGIGGESVEETERDLQEALAGATAAWYMPRWTEVFWDPQQRVRNWLDGSWCLANAPRFDVVELREYVPCQRTAIVTRLGPTLTATPNPVPAGFGSGVTTIQWDTYDGSMGQVYAGLSGGPEELFAQGGRGKQEANWIQTGSLYVFRLYSGTDRAKLLQSLAVFRSAS